MNRDPGSQKRTQTCHIGNPALDLGAHPATCARVSVEKSSCRSAAADECPPGWQFNRLGLFFSDLFLGYFWGRFSGHFALLNLERNYSRKNEPKSGPKRPKLEVYACILFKRYFGPVLGPILGLFFGPRTIELPAWLPVRVRELGRLRRRVQPGAAQQRGQVRLEGLHVQHVVRPGPAGCKCNSSPGNLTENPPESTGRL